jgi:hypothetical protein
VAPVIEEGLKTLAGTLAGASLIITHIFFGVVEAFYDVSGPSKRGVTAALFSVSSHLLFGFLAQVAVFAGQHWWWGVLAAYPVHALFNHVVLSMSPGSPRR